MGFSSALGWAEHLPPSTQAVIERLTVPNAVGSFSRAGWMYSYRQDFDVDTNGTW
jgi:hypothetical protein